MKRVLIVYYTLGGNTEKAAEFIKKGIESEGVEVVMKKGIDTTLEDLLDCDGIVIGSPDYFSYMAGGLKDFFDRTYYPSRGKVEGKPYFAFLTHGGGGKAIESIEKISASFKFKKVMNPVLIKNAPSKQDGERLFEAGKEFAKIIKG
ncbi:MAG: NAD(P)H-dependent oxidoreductase [Candidatus Omnitrophica bacterium]|nr:NAD(P)H-dependent oxidoreductase [Candidatus Omnitrophota bacterium]MCM8803568.1 NAD(P)H-dependent oxidoreductase [Candidatus Omnitrophota bacterium]